MYRCASCSAELQTRWKFCIHCGTAVSVVAVAPVRAPPAEPRAQLTALGLFGWGLAVLLASIGVVAAAVLSTS
jgi:hypothetical protein